MKPTKSLGRILFVFMLAGAAAAAQDNNKPVATEASPAATQSAAKPEGDYVGAEVCVWLDVATAIHFYEAVLASLAIVVWHFYQVFFDPDAYPMNWAWWDGQLPLEHY